ncbi:MAG TPA: hypothetical protein VGK73_27345, partial [Polyangiaceae bacterium]
MTACSSEDNNGDDDDDNGGSSGTSAGGKGGSTAGGQGGTTAGTGTAGSASGSAGTSAGMAGSSGSGAGTAGTGGSTAGSSGSGGGAGMEGFSCKAVAATCSTITDFPASGMCFGTGDFKGGTGSPYGGGLTLDTTGGDLHVTGTVGTYSGFNLWFSYCSDLSAYTGIEFTISGTVMAAGTAANTIDFQLQTNSDFPWQTADNMAKMKGACTSDTPADPWGDCIAPSLNVPIPAEATMPVTVLWTQMAGGTPVMWDPVNSPKEILGIQWQFPWGSAATEYTVDVHIDNIKFVGGTDTACTTGSCSGSGGAGGAAGASGAGGAGGAGAGGAASAGMGGGGATCTGST